MPAPAYEPNPCYAAVGGAVVAGWDEPAARLPEHPVVLAVDGPAILDWDRVRDGLGRALTARGQAGQWLDVRAWFAPWPEIVRGTGSVALADDPDFDRLAGGDLAQLFGQLPVATRPRTGVLVAFGPGAALLGHDLLWYVDLPKRFAEAEVVAGRGHNLGQQSGIPTTKRLFYIDWPLLDRHRDAIAPHIDRFVDVQDPGRPTSIDGPTLRTTVGELARRPLRTRPTFNTTPWGGHWAQRRLGVNPDAPSTALGYELIAPESGVLVGDATTAVELPFQLVVTTHPDDVVGPDVRATFGTSFPVRFDYLDTVGGGNLSVHCHPRPAYMRDVFGWPYPQHETYYLMVGGPDRVVYLGLRGDADVSEFHTSAEQARDQGVPLEMERYVQTFPADPHQLFCVPAGTPHGSGEGNVVLEVSATPYLYSLRFYDWLRRDADDRQRPVHVEHAFDNLDTRRTGAAVGSELVQAPRTLRQGPGWREELLGSLPEMFFEVRRLVLGSDEPATDDTRGRFHVLNVVEGDGVEIEPTSGLAHLLAYAETLVVPAAVGTYRVRRIGDRQARVVKAVVR